MSAQDVLTVSIAVGILTQFAKWQGVPDGHGPILVLVLSLIGVGFWGYSVGNFGRETSFLYFSGWLSVSLNAAGIFGFTRRAASAVTALKESKTRDITVEDEPAKGAGADTTKKL